MRQWPPWRWCNKHRNM